MSTRRKPLREASCVVCGLLFLTRNPSQKACTDACSRVMQSRRQQEARRRPIAERPQRDQDIANMYVGMDKKEEALMAGRCRRRLLDGIPKADLLDMYPAGMVRAVYESLTPEEMKQREDEAGLAIGEMWAKTRGPGWREKGSMGRFFLPWKGDMGWLSK